jgi:hypothetical protein
MIFNIVTGLIVAGTAIICFKMGFTYGYYKREDKQPEVQIMPEIKKLEKKLTKAEMKKIEKEFEEEANSFYN